MQKFSPFTDNALPEERRALFILMLSASVAMTDLEFESVEEYNEMVRLIMDNYVGEITPDEVLTLQIHDDDRVSITTSENFESITELVDASDYDL